jgi:hypothetical protein
MAGNSFASIDSFRYGVDHLETCLNATARAGSYDRIRSMEVRQADGTLLIPEPSPGSILSDGRQTIRRIRNAVEHMDEWIEDGRLPTGKPTAVDPRIESFRIEDIEFGYDDLVRWIAELHALADRIASFRPSQATSP